MCHLLCTIRRHKVTGCIFRRYTGIEFKPLTACFVYCKLYEFLIKCRHTVHIWQHDIPSKFCVPCVKQILIIMLGNPSAGTYPVNDYRNNLGRSGYSRGSACRHVNAINAEQLSGILFKCRNPVIHIFKNCLIVLYQIPAQAMPINHLKIFICHIVRPLQLISASPQPIKREWIGSRVAATDK